METLRKAGKSLKELSDYQLEVMSQNLSDSRKPLKAIAIELSRKIVTMVCTHPISTLNVLTSWQSSAGQHQDSQCQLLLQKKIQTELAVTDIGLDRAAVKEEQRRRREVAAVQAFFGNQGAAASMRWLNNNLE